MRYQGNQQVTLDGGSRLSGNDVLKHEQWLEHSSLPYVRDNAGIPADRTADNPGRGQVRGNPQSCSDDDG